MEKINLNEELLNKVVLTMTGCELLKLLQQARVTETKATEEQLSPTYHSELPRFVTGIKELGRVLHVSSSTVARWKSEGILDDVTFQNGKFISFDVYGVLEKLRVSNKKVKFNKKIRYHES